MTARMRGILLTGLAAANFLLGGLSTRDAEAAMLGAPTMSHAGQAPVVQRVTNVCGANGCVRVQTQRVQHQKPGSVPGKHI
jgi:hypothetical protein